MDQKLQITPQMSDCCEKAQMS